MRRTRGMSVIELLVGLTIIAVATGAVARAFSAGLDYQRLSEKTRDRIDARNRFEDKLANLIRGATLSGAYTYFISPIPVSGTGGGQTAPQSILPAGSASLIVTSLFDAAPVRYLTNQESDFSKLNEMFGPQAGVEEDALSMVPAGDAGLKQGLFLRQQRPADSDPKQGGTEFDLNPEVADIRFEFYDGTDWQTTWDSTSDTQKNKLPIAVRVTYLLNNDQRTYTFIVRLMIASPPATNSNQSGGTPPPGGSPSGGPPSGTPSSSTGGGQ